MGRISFQKRQKEMKRQEKQQMKAEKRAQRKLARNTEGTPEAQAGLENQDLLPGDAQASEGTEEEHNHNAI